MMQAWVVFTLKPTSKECLMILVVQKPDQLILGELSLVEVLR